MAAQTYAELQRQISDLQVQANKLKTDEVAGVVSRIKEAITTYSLKPQDLFGGKPGRVKANGKDKSATKGKTSAAPKYVDGKGGQWVGLGKRPKWLSEALAAGARLEDFLAEKFKSAVEAFSSPPAEVVAPVEKAASSKSATMVPTKAKKVKPSAVGKKTARSVRASYADGAGNSWTGMGPTPRWLKEAVAGGKAKEDFLVKA
jgi:DNA-binding protein H-NS